MLIFVANLKKYGIYIIGVVSYFVKYFINLLNPKLW